MDKGKLIDLSKKEFIISIWVRLLYINTNVRRKTIRRPSISFLTEKNDQIPFKAISFVFQVQIKK